MLRSLQKDKCVKHILMIPYCVAMMDVSLCAYYFVKVHWSYETRTTYRFLSFELCFENNVELKNEYIKFINECKSLGHLKQLFDNDNGNACVLFATSRDCERIEYVDVMEYNIKAYRCYLYLRCTNSNRVHVSNVVCAK